MNGIPCFSSGNADLDKAFRLALDTLELNTRRTRSGLMRGPGPCLMAGADYPSQWTRDAAINVWFAEALLEPETALNTLLSVLALVILSPLLFLTALLVLLSLLSAPLSAWIGGLV